MPIKPTSAFSGAGPADAAEARNAGLRIAGLLLLAVLCGLAIALAGESALFLTLALVGCIFTFIDFRVGVVLLILLVPIANSSVFPHQLFGITGLNPFNVLLMGTLASYWLRSRPGEAFRDLLPQKLIWLYIIPIVFAGMLGSRHVGDMAHSLYAAGTIEFTGAAGYLRDVVIKPLLFVLFALLVSRAVARSSDPARFIMPMLLSVCIMSLMSVLYVYLSGYSLGELASSTARTFFLPLGIHANDLGRLYAVAYGMLLFCFAATERPQMKVPLLIAMGAVVIALVFTFSRGAFVGFMVINLIFLLSRRNVAGFLVFLVLLALAMAFMPGAVYERLAAGFDGNLNALTAGRTEEIWLPLLPEMSRSPLWGNGLLSITWSDAMTHNTILPVTHPHNAYLQAYMDMGILGLGLLLAYFWHVWHGLRSLSRDERVTPGMRGVFEGAAAGLVCLLIAGMAGGGLTPGPEQSFLWLAIGFMYGEQARQRQATQAQAAAAGAARQPGGMAGGPSAVPGAMA